MADVLNFTVNRAFDINGDPAPGAQAFFFDAGTSNPRTVFADPEGTIPHPSPLVADSEGVFPPVYSSGGSGVAVEMMDEDGVMLDGYPMPLAVQVPSEGFNASGIAFAPTGDIPANNVQEAIERVQENLIEPLASYGLGVTGNAPLLANLDAIDIPSGMYRYDNSTIGTFPAGVSAANGGVVTFWRRDNASGVMTLFRADQDGMFMRRLSAGSPQVWVQVYVPFATTAQATAGTSNAVTMSPATTKSAIESGKLVTAGAVGSTAYLVNRSNATVNYGGTRNGSDLSPSANNTSSSATLSGVWRCLGYAPPISATLFVRIS